MMVPGSGALRCTGWTVDRWCRAQSILRLNGADHVGTESLRTRRWRKADSNSWSHLWMGLLGERDGNNESSRTLSSANAGTRHPSRLGRGDGAPTQLVTGGLAVRIHLPPAASQMRTRSRVQALIQQDAGAAAAWFPALTTMAGLQANGDS
jgi:hypothetical protein